METLNSSAISTFATAGLVVIILMVLVLPFMVKIVEHQLEVFLFIMGALAVTVSQLWSAGLVHDALLDPVRWKHPIVQAVLVAGLIFRGLRSRIRGAVNALEKAVGDRAFFFILVFGLGLLSSVITAIIAALVLAEVVTALKLDKRVETNLVIVTCFSIGLGAVLTPVGEPLATIAIAKLSGDPFHAGFWFLFQKLGVLIIAGMLALALFAATFRGHRATGAGTLSEDAPETLADVLVRTGKVYLFVVALVLLGSGFQPIIDLYVLPLSGALLFWINMISAILDNATLTAAELSPKMSMGQIQAVLMGLLISGGMLIPGNIPNIISAGKLKIGSRDWARLGVPLGLVVMAVYFVVLFFVQGGAQ
jgi:predicted cation transporter